MLVKKIQQVPPNIYSDSIIYKIKQCPKVNSIIYIYVYMEQVR